jgi:rubrerythrin
LAGILQSRFWHKKKRSENKKQDGFVHLNKEGIYLKKWLCNICGEIFEGGEPPVPCPICGAGREEFEEVEGE